jgi:hypothetical protein
LVLIGWSASVPFKMLPHLTPLRWRDWNPTTTDKSIVASPENDLLCAARSMSYLLGASTDPAITRHLQRAGASHDAWKLLDDFDKLIDALWGPRQFRPLAMPRTN